MTTTSDPTDDLTTRLAQASVTLVHTALEAVKQIESLEAQIDLLLDQIDQDTRLRIAPLYVPEWPTTLPDTPKPSENGSESQIDRSPSILDTSTGPKLTDYDR